MNNLGKEVTMQYIEVLNNLFIFLLQENKGLLASICVMYTATAFISTVRSILQGESHPAETHYFCS